MIQLNSPNCICGKTVSVMSTVLKLCNFAKINYDNDTLGPGSELFITTLLIFTTTLTLMLRTLRTSAPANGFTTSDRLSIEALTLGMS